jgi:hypothetical protein
MARPKKTLKLSQDAAPVGKLRTTLETRLHDAGYKPVCELGVRSEAAARFWSERAWSEFTAIPGMSQTLLAAVREQRGIDLIAALNTITSDEIRHTEQSRDLAQALGHYEDTIPEWSQYDPSTLGDPFQAPLISWVVGNACVSETVSLELMRARMKHTTHPQVRKLLERIVQDEAVHARLGWIMAQDLVPKLGASQKRELLDYVNAYFEVLEKTFITRGLPRSQKQAARKVRAKTATLGLGACPPEVEDAVFDTTILETIVPRLLKLMG